VEQGEGRGKLGGEGGYGRRQRSATAVGGTGQRSNAGAETAKKVGKDRDKTMIEVSNFNYVKVGIEHEMYVCVEE